MPTGLSHCASVPPEPCAIPNGAEKCDESAPRKRSRETTGEGRESPKRRILTQQDAEEQKTGWEIDGFGQDNALDMGAMLQAPVNENPWILRENLCASTIDAETEYFQLQETRLNSDHEDPSLFPLPDIAPELHLDLSPSLANIPSHPTVQVNSSTGAIASAPNLPAQPTSSSNNNSRSVPHPKSTPLPPFQTSATNTTPAQDLFVNVTAPHIETRIFSAPQSTPRSSPIRILPRESKTELKDPAQSSASSHPKKSRAGPQLATAPDHSPNSFSGPTAPPAVPAVPFALDPQHLNAALSVSGANQSPAAPPHPMAGPLLFAQGFSPLPNHSSTGVPPAVLSNAPGIQSPYSPFVRSPHRVPSKQRTTTTSQSVGSDCQGPQQSSMLFPPSFPPNVFPNQNGAAPVDPNTLMRMAQQMWYAAMAASGNPILPQSVPSPNRPPFFANPTFFNPAQTGAQFAPPGPPGSSSTPSNKDGNSISMMNLGHGKTRPVFITDDGKHVVVEQQAPAKLMKHPVLGRLQLASNPQPILNQSPAAQPPAVLPASDNKPPTSAPSSEPVSSPGGSNGKDRRKRLVWTPELHDRFVQAIGAVGIHQAVPKTLVQIMNVEGLTTEHVKSHLQKYRNQLRKNTSDDDRGRDVDPPGARRIIERVPGGGDGGREVRVLPNRPSTVTTNVAATVRMLVKPQHAVSAVAKGENQPLAKGNVIPSTTLRPAVLEGATPVPTAVENGVKAAAGDDVATDDGKRVRMQKRAMDLQYQLQVMVFRAVALQKQLQVSIEKENEPKRSRVVTATSDAAVDSAKDEDEEEDVSGKRKESINLETEIQELDREKKKVMAELGKLQDRIGDEGCGGKKT